ncbi:MAG: hypothetical protein V4732_11445 [Pseudomonadota bacterium]
MLTIISSFVPSKVEKYCVYAVETVVALSILCMAAVAVFQVQAGVI